MSTSTDTRSPSAGTVPASRPARDSAGSAERGAEPGRQADLRSRAATGRAARRLAILDLVAGFDVTSQAELASLLRARGFAVTQATVSRDIADLGLVKAPHGDRHVYVTPRALAGEPAGGSAGRPVAGPTGASSSYPGEARLRRILADYPVRIRRSGLILVLVSTPGSAAAIAQALDEAPLGDEVGTVAGDNTLLVLFPDEPALERWRARFAVTAAEAAGGLPSTDLTSAYP